MIIGTMLAGVGIVFLGAKLNLIVSCVTLVLGIVILLLVSIL
jgi:hypothetical protein